MIIISKHTNQLCNRLFTYLPVLSYALEAGERACFLFQYSGYDKFFPNLRNEGIRSYCCDATLRPSIKSKMLNGLVRIADKAVHLVLKHGEPLPLRKPLGCLFNPKWKEIRYDKAYIQKHSDSLRRLFAPSPEVMANIAEMLGSDRSKITVGVHMRGGDYRTYLGGKYFYEPQIYLEYMHQMNRLLAAENKQARFLLCTNEKTDPTLFGGLDVVMQKGNCMLTDLYGLSSCDYIIGPPSTFSQWASFWGKTPLRVLYSANEPLFLSDFKRVVALDTFE